jgi:phospholipid transport system transporter-binding protein
MQITQMDNRWKISGKISMDNANAILVESSQLTFAESGLVDFMQVEEIDTAALSLILEWKRRAIAENKQIRFVNLPDNLKSLSHLYGIADLIN